MKTESRIVRAIRAGKKAMTGQRYGANNTKFQCSMCGHDRFKAGLYVTILMMHTLICSECSHVQFFEKMPKANRLLSVRV
jgi:transcription elongation factor Elf1